MSGKINQKIVLCAGSAYTEKYYINPDFATMPKSVLEELRVLVITLSAKINGIIQIGFKENGDVFIEVMGDQLNFNFDEIDARLQVNKAQKDNEQLFNGLVKYYKYFVDEEGKKALEKLINENND